MSNPTVNKTRRRVMKTVALGTTLLPLSYVLTPRFGYAQEKVDENDPAATSLNYKHDASNVTNPKRTPDQFCSNCQLFQAKGEEDWAPCAIFQNKLVARNGWCNAWVKKAG